MTTMLTWQFMLCVIMQPHRINVPPVAEKEVTYLLGIMGHLDIKVIRAYAHIMCADQYRNINQSSAFEMIMSSTKPQRKAGTKKRQVAHATIFTGSVHKTQLEAREAVTSKTDLNSVPEAYHSITKNPKRKRSPTNSCTEPQGTKTVNQLGNTASDCVNRTAKNPICP